MSTVEPCRMPHWLTPVCDDHPVSQPTSTWLPSRIHRCRVGTSPERSARRSTAWATPSSWMNTTPGTSVTSASFDRRRAWRAMRWSSHESSSMASSALTNVVTMTSPMTTHSAVQNPSISTPGSSVEQQEHEQRVEDDRAQPERQHRERDDEERQRRPDDGVGDADDEPGQQRIPQRVDREARQDGGEQPQPERGDDRDDDGAPQDRAPRRAVSGGADDIEVGGEVICRPQLAWSGMVRRIRTAASSVVARSSIVHCPSSIRTAASRTDRDGRLCTPPSCRHRAAILHGRCDSEASR